MTIIHKLQWYQRNNDSIWGLDNPTVLALFREIPKRDVTMSILEDRIEDIQPLTEHEFFLLGTGSPVKIYNSLNRNQNDCIGVVHLEAANLLDREGNIV